MEEIILTEHYATSFLTGEKFYREPTTSVLGCGSGSISGTGLTISEVVPPQPIVEFSLQEKRIKASNDKVNLFIKFLSQLILKKSNLGKNKCAMSKVFYTTMDRDIDHDSKNKLILNNNEIELVLNKMKAEGFNCKFSFGKVRVYLNQNY